ncbi:MAG: hypothetical protein BM564_08705 [Bacteroidetes bacterium MedPE-SWsnd-G2]|nr:MAG: hypothetical protein BM564_08705 [Bacteroidetes bacterium MedPE-SWsnd-G2]
MRYLTILLFSLLFVQSSQSQIYEIGGFLGGSNFIGDVGATNYISPNQLAFGGVFKWNRSPRHSFRFSLIYSELEGKDSKSDDPRRLERDYSFSNDIVEMSAGMEFTFLDFNLHDSGNKFTPYLYSGVSAAKHDNFFIDQNGNNLSENTSSWAWGIPMALGFKTNIGYKWVFALEVGARYTFSDEIDGSVPDSEERELASFGNTNNNDWYVFSGVTLTYTFGRKPCYCNY